MITQLLICPVQMFHTQVHSSLKQNILEIIRSSKVNSSSLNKNQTEIVSSEKFFIVTETCQCPLTLSKLLRTMRSSSIYQFLLDFTCNCIGKSRRWCGIKSSQREIVKDAFKCLQCEQIPAQSQQQRYFKNIHGNCSLLTLNKYLLMTSSTELVIFKLFMNLC